MTNTNNFNREDVRTCHICQGGSLSNATDPEYERCDCCGTEIAVDMNPRPAEEYETVEWYGDRWEFDVVAGLINSDNQVLELGCGEGHFSRKLLGRGIRYEGVDFNPKALAVAQKAVRLESHRYLNDITSSGTKFDVLCAFHVVEHIPYPAAFFEKLLIEKGINQVYFSVPNPGRLMVKLGIREQWDFPPHHLYRFSEAGLSRMMSRIGFKTVFTLREPLRDEEFSEIIMRMTPSWMPIRDRMIHKLIRLFQKVPANRRPKMGQAMLMAFEVKNRCQAEGM